MVLFLRPAEMIVCFGAFATRHVGHPDHDRNRSMRWQRLMRRYEQTQLKRLIGPNLKAGLAGELHVDIMPVFLYNGLRPFEEIGAESIRLDRIKVMELPAGRTHLRFRVVK